MRLSRRLFFFVTAALTYLLALTMTMAAETGTVEGVIVPAAATPAPPAFPAQAAPATQAGEYAGTAMCLMCHDEKGPQLAGTPHGHPENPRTPMAAQGCETCHGPGKAHAESGDPAMIRRFAEDTPPRQASAVCTTCHNRGTHSQWSGSMHDTRNLSCVTCHSVHSPKSETAQLKTETEIGTCIQCHKAQALKVQRNTHMPVREGKMTCTSCHNPHGSTNVRMLKVGNWVNESCTSCHSEKRGPYLWEHAAGRENCASCHDPHGSNNDRMLVAKSPMLCQRCHVSSRHPATIYDATQVGNASNRVVGRSCVNCHSQIHGSNAPAGNFFLR